MSNYPSFKEKRKGSVRNWTFQLPPLDSNFTLSPLEKTALAAWKAQGPSGRHCRKIEPETMEQLKRLTQPIEAALLHYGIKQEGGGYAWHACILLLLHEMHRRQTSLWAWDATAWAEIAGNTNKEFKSIHHAFEHAYHISAFRYRHGILACAYLLGEIPIYQLVADYRALNAAQNMFGGVAVEKAMHALTTERTRIGRGVGWKVSVATCSALLANRSPDLEKLTLPVLEKLYETYSHDKELRNSYILLSILLYNFKILPDCLHTPYAARESVAGKDDTLSVDWANLLQAWYDNSTESEVIRKSKRRMIAKVARWATETYSDAASAHQWTRRMAIACVAAVTRMQRGQFLHPKTKPSPHWGKPIKASYQGHLLGCLRSFFNDCHEWEWFPRSFTPDRYLATPRGVLRKRRQNPRPVAPAQWTKLREAALSLTEEDLPITNLALVEQRNATPNSWYPLDMMRAMAIVWLYTGLRSDEIRRLQVGCIRPIPWEEKESISSLPPAICSLTVPVGKNGYGFSKPVPGLVGDVIAIWEKSRPTVPKHWDVKIAEAVDFLFVWRGKHIGTKYFNTTIIPMLCRKAGIPIEDAFGKITCHRARHTLAHELGNAPKPMADTDLQDWFGHLSSASIDWYKEINMAKLQEAYTAANQISVDKRQLEQLKAPPAIDSPAAPVGASGPSVDLGHGFCTYAFFAQCTQRTERTSCEKCSFYKPKESLYSHLREAISKLQYLLHHFPLSKEARQAVEEGIALNEMLVAIMKRDEENRKRDEELHPS